MRAPSPPTFGHPNVLDFMQLSGNFGKIICWCLPSGQLAPPLGNPGSATDVQCTRSHLSIRCMVEIGSNTGDSYFLGFSSFLEKQKEVHLNVGYLGPFLHSTRHKGHRTCVLVIS